MSPRLAVPEPRESEPPEPRVIGVFEVDLDRLPDWPRIPRSVSLVRVAVGRTWVDWDVVVRLANSCWLAGVPIEVVGDYGPALDYAIHAIERRLAECRQAARARSEQIQG